MCNELAGPIFASLRPSNTAFFFEEMLQQRRAVGNTMSDLTGLRFEHQTYRYRDERVIPLDQLYNFNDCKSFEQGVSNVAYQYTGIISIQYRYVSFETPCIYFLTNLAQKYNEQVL